MGINEKYVCLSTGLGQGKTFVSQTIAKDIVVRRGKAMFICNRIALKEDNVSQKIYIYNMVLV